MVGRVGNSCEIIRDNPDGLRQRATYSRLTPGHVAIIANACGDEAICGGHKHFGVPQRVPSVVPKRAVRSDTPTHCGSAAERRRVQGSPGLRLEKLVPVTMCGEVAKDVAQTHMDSPGRPQCRRDIGEARAHRMGSSAARKIVAVADGLIGGPLATRCTKSSRLEPKWLEQIGADQVLPTLTKLRFEHRSGDHVTAVRVFEC